MVEFFNPTNMVANIVSDVCEISGDGNGLDQRSLMELADRCGTVLYMCWFGA